MKFSSAFALPALFLVALAAPVEKRQVVDVSSITALVTDLLADIIPITAAINATTLNSVTASVDVGVQVAEITTRVAHVVDQVGNILGDAITVTTGTVNTVGDIAGSAVGSVSGTVGSLQSRQIVDIGSIVDLNSAIALVVTEISATLEAANTVTAIPADALATLGSTITSLTSILSVVTNLTASVNSIIPANLLSLLGLAL